MRGLRPAAVQPKGDALIGAGLMPTAGLPNEGAPIDAGFRPAAVQPNGDALIGNMSGSRRRLANFLTLALLTQPLRALRSSKTIRTVRRM